MTARLAITIPTRDRPAALARLVESIARQSALPDLLLIVDDNQRDGEVTPPRLGMPAHVIRGQRRGPAWAHHAALEHVSLLPRPPELILRLDDDLVLETPDFIERLVALMTPGVGAAGGVYPEPHRRDPVVIERIGTRGYSLTIGGMLRGEESAQFFRWDRSRVVEAEHLYSSFVYRRQAALAAGGHSIWYSAQGHREETDFTHRLYLAGWKLLVDTGAVARHERGAQGGLREVAREQLSAADEAIFLDRLGSGDMRPAAGEGAWASLRADASAATQPCGWYVNTVPTITAAKPPTNQPRR